MRAVRLAIVGAALLAAGGWMWHMHWNEDMPHRLREVLAAQQAWDNAWDLQDRKIASLRQDLARSEEHTSELQSR